MTKSGQKDQSARLQDKTKKEIIHQYKLALVRECQIYGKPLEEVQAYFKTKGLKISKSSWVEYKNELKSAKSAQDWFSKESLYVIEEDHMISVETERLLEDTLKNQMLKLIADDDFETKVTYATKEDKQVMQRVKNYNLELFDRLVARWESLQMTKTKMFSATPMVQEMMEVHRRQEQEEQKPKTATKDMTKSVKA